MKFLGYNQLTQIPHVIVDGVAAADTVLTLSHWPKSGTPSAMRGDTSTDIVFNYLDAPRFHVLADVVSNNHFDEDGLVGVFALIQPSFAERHRDLLVDAARAGDFGVFERREAARIAFTLSAHADQATSPLPRRIFGLPYADLASELYVQLLDLLPRLLANVDDYRPYWHEEDAKLAASQDLLDRGVITIGERPDVDLAIVRLPDDLAAHSPDHRLLECHPFALHTRTPCSRILLVQGSRVELQYRYESWVQMASRRPAARVDLSGLADQLNREEASGGRWVFDGISQITPRLHLEGSSGSSIPPEDIVTRTEHYLRTGTPAWDPYDP